jgi:Ca2+-binding EF-hand superfamily protein
MQAANLLTTEVREMFDDIDENGDRSISFDEFVALLRKLDHAKSETELWASFNAVDTNRDGQVSFDEFCAWMTR